METVNVNKSVCDKQCSGLIVTSFYKSAQISKHMKYMLSEPDLELYNVYKKMTENPAKYAGKTFLPINKVTFIIIESFIIIK